MGGADTLDLESYNIKVPIKTIYTMDAETVANFKATGGASGRFSGQSLMVNYEAFGIEVFDPLIEGIGHYRVNSTLRASMGNGSTFVAKTSVDRKTSAH